MQIIFLNRFFYPDHSATSQILSELAFSLVESGKNITIITSQLRYDSTSVRLPAREQINNVTIHRVYTSRFGRGNLAGRSVDYLTFYIFAVLKLLIIAHRGDIVVAKTDPPLISVAILPVIWLKRAKLINWLQDLFPEVASALGIGRGKAAPLFLVLKKLRNLSLKAAVTNVVIGDLMDERLQRLNIPDHKITRIPNWSDGALIRPIDHQENPVRNKWKLGDRFVVGYSGNLGRAHDFSSLLEAASKLTDSTNNIVFLFIGGGAQYRSIEVAAKRRGLSNFRFEPYQPRERLAESLSAIDLHIVTLKPELEGLIVPSKFYGIAAAGRPTLFIGDTKGELSRLLEEEECGLTVSPSNAEDLAIQIGRLANDRELCRTMGDKARTAFEQRFDKKIAVDKWARLFDHFHDKKPTPHI